MRTWIIWALFCLPAEADAADLRLTVAEPTGVARQQWPVTSGIPLAQGALRDDHAAALFDAAGRVIDYPHVGYIAVAANLAAIGFVSRVTPHRPGPSPTSFRHPG